MRVVRIMVDQVEREYGSMVVVVNGYGRRV